MKITQPLHRLKIAKERIANKTLGQLLRYAFINVWPLAYLGRQYYAVKFSRLVSERINKVGRDAHNSNKIKLSITESTFLSALETDGVFIDHNQQLFSIDDVASLREAADRYLKNPKIATQLVNRKSTDGAKWYTIRAFGLKPPALSPEIQNIVFNESLLNIVSGYLGTWPKLRYIDIWCNIAAEENEPATDSEFWHRDHEDLNILTLFLYLDDVASDQGPFSYVKESQCGGSYGHIAPAHPPRGSYPSSATIFSQIPVKHVIEYPGQCGTAILCDTSGLHRGGRVQHGRRLLLTVRYFTSAGLDRIPYTIKNNAVADLDPRIQFLVS